MTVRNVLVVVVVFVAGCAVGRFSLPAKIVEKERIVYQERIVEKRVEATKDHKVTTKLEMTKPDGTKTIETKIVNEKYSDSNIDTIMNKDGSKVMEKENTSQTNTIVSLLANATYSISIIGPNLGIMAQRRLIGPIYIGGFGYTDRSFGLSLGLAF